jgi:ppGpp synthetase/RelA/SpoT-type nucleotidyltranferase
MAPTQRSVHDRDSSTVVISQFVKEWPFEAKYYEKAARLASKLCEILLAEHAIQAVVTYSVKKSHRLDAKLQERVWKRGSGYDTFEDIRTDIVDLAGVRITVYFPSDKKKILRMIDGDFCEVKSVEHPKVKARDLEAKQRAASTFSQETYQRRFDGYAADHYRVEMKVDRLAKLADGDLRKWLRSSKPRIEIQVCKFSILTSACFRSENGLGLQRLVCFATLMELQCLTSFEIN